MENMFAQSFVEREVDRNKYYAGCTTYTTAARDARTLVTNSGLLDCKTCGTSRTLKQIEEQMWGRR